MFHDGAGSGCSGTLVNNENNNGIPYFYTAHHCLPSNSIDLAKSSFQFKFWQTACYSGVNTTGIEFYGSTLLYETSQPGGDQALLLLNSGPGIIHHPELADMRFTSPSNIRDYWWDRNFWKATYSWGVVRPGSSGSAIFNENKQIIGTLSKGSSNCWWQWLGDRYGKFRTGWSGMAQYLAPTTDNFSMDGLPLSGLTISGLTILNCNAAPQVYSVPNLVGCNFNWTVSPNLNIISGNGTHAITVQYIGSNQQLDFGHIDLVINDSKGSIPNGRRATASLDIHTGNGEITGTVQQQYIINSLATVNAIRPNSYTVTEFTSPFCTSTTATLIGGNPQWSFSGGQYGHLWINIQSGQSAVFDITTTTTNCGTSKRTVVYYASSGGYFYQINPNPATNNLTIKVVKDENDLTNLSRKDSELNYYIRFIDFMTGIEVMRLKANIGELIKQINVSSLKRGHYIIQIVEGVNTSTQHIILQ